MNYKINNVKYCSQIEYGIDVFSNGELIKSFESISDNRSDIERLVAMCNELEVETCHLEYIIEDYLTDFKI